MSIKDLSTALADPGTTGKLKEKIAEELKQRFGEKISSGSGTVEDERKSALLTKLLEGTITESENDELGDLMGVVLPRLDPKPGQGNKV